MGRTDVMRKVDGDDADEQRAHNYLTLPFTNLAEKHLDDDDD